MYREILKSANDKGTIILFGDSGAVRASILLAPDSSIVGAEILNLTVDYASNDKAAKAWVFSQLRKIKPMLSDRTVLFLNYNRISQLNDFIKIGFGIESVILDGEVKKSLRKYEKLKNFPKDLKHLSLQIKKAKKSDITRIMQINKLEFSRNPQFGWFCQFPEFIKKQKEEIASQLSKKSHSHFVILKNKKVVGYFAAFVDKNLTMAGITLLLDKSIQGKGIAKTAYLILLKELDRRKVKRLRGGTSQKAVMKLGKLMGRRAVITMLRYKSKFFEPEYFSDFLN